MKRILHIISQKPGDTGSGVYLENLIHHSNKNGFVQGVVFGSNGKNDEGVVGIPKKWQYSIPFESDELPFSIVGMSDVMPYRSSIFSKLDFEMNVMLKSAYKKVVMHAIETFKPDVILSHHLWLITSITKLLTDEHFPHIPVYGFCHGTDLRQLSLSKEHAEDVIQGCSKLDGIFALNEHQKIQIESKYKNNKITVLGNGYNSKYFYKEDKCKKSDKTELIYAGKLSKAKGLIELINAYKTLDSNAFKLKIVGGGQGEEFDQIISLINNTEGVDYLGKLTQRELGDRFRESDIFVLPSFYEGLPLVLIESLACGLKVLCTDIPGVKDWLGSGILSSGIVRFIDLPKMKSIDVPHEDHVQEFERNIADSICSIAEINDIVFDYNHIDKMSWDKIFCRIVEALGHNINAELR